jgi:hypothetical protein
MKSQSLTFPSATNPKSVSLHCTTSAIICFNSPAQLQRRAAMPLAMIRTLHPPHHHNISHTLLLNPLLYHIYSHPLNIRRQPPHPAAMLLLPSLSPLVTVTLAANAACSVMPVTLTIPKPKPLISHPPNPLQLLLTAASASPCDLHALPPHLT